VQDTVIEASQEVCKRGLQLALLMADKFSNLAHQGPCQSPDEQTHEKLRLLLSPGLIAPFGGGCRVVCALSSDTITGQNHVGFVPRK
jgi:hypothetical protein